MTNGARVRDVEVFTLPHGDDVAMIVRVGTDDGLYGLGEVGLRTRQRAVRGALEHLSAIAIGQPADRIERLWQLCWRGGFYPADRVVASALAALDTALWDIHGRRLGVPVHDLLGAPVRDRVPAYAHLDADRPDTDAVVEHAQVLVAAGWRHLRLSVPSWQEEFDSGAAMRLTIDRLHALRAAVGPDVELLLDVHTRLSAAESSTLCRAVEDVRPYFVEDPLRAEMVTGYHALRSRTGVALAAGEQFASKWDFRPLIEGELIDHARIDVGIAGGISEFRKIAAACETHDIAVSPHFALSPVGTAAVLHADLTCASFGVQEHSGAAQEGFGDWLSGRPEVRDGHLRPAPGPGLGVELDVGAARRITAAIGERPMLRRPDGAPTNW